MVERNDSGRDSGQVFGVATAFVANEKPPSRGSTNGVAGWCDQMIYGLQRRDLCVTSRDCQAVITVMAAG